MAKINGQRVEMSEVEAALRRLEGVDRAEVVFHEEDGKGKLVAFVVPNEPASDGLPQLLRRQLAITLPPFMILPVSSSSIPSHVFPEAKWMPRHCLIGSVLDGRNIHFDGGGATSGGEEGLDGDAAPSYIRPNN